MDYRLTDTSLDPPGETDAFYVERSIRLPHTVACYDPLTDEPAVNELPASACGRITFGCLNNFCKINDRVLEAWSAVLAAARDSRLLCLAPRGEARHRMAAKFASLGIDPRRIDFVDPRPRPQYLELYHQIDVALDTVPYNGHTTSLDGLWMGVPVLSLGGSSASSRLGTSVLANLGLGEFVARTPAELAAIAARIAAEIPRLAALRAGLRERMRQSPLMDAGGFARHVEAAYRQMWHTWCNTVCGKSQ